MQLKDIKPFLSYSVEKKSIQKNTVGEKILCINDLNEKENPFEGKYVILGVPDDRGIVARGNHAGSKDGPKNFRNEFYKLYSTQLREYNPVTHHPYPPSQNRTGKTISLAEYFIDIGDIVLSKTIEETHDRIAKVVQYLLDNNVNAIFVIGGGHDLSYGSYKGHVASRKKEVIPVINFDSTFNFHPVKNNVQHNGTHFYKIIKDFSKNILAGKALLEIGIQRERNPHELYDYARENEIPVVEYLPLLNLWRDLQQAHSQLPVEHIRDHIDDCAEHNFNRYKGSLHLSLSLNIFNHNYAPGAAASTPMGVFLHDISRSLVFFSKARVCRVVDIVELCPPLDFHDQTSRLVASLVYRFALVREEYSSR